MCQKLNDPSSRLQVSNTSHFSFSKLSCTLPVCYWLGYEYNNTNIFFCLINMMCCVHKNNDQNNNIKNNNINNRATTMKINIALKYNECKRMIGKLKIFCEQHYKRSLIYSSSFYFVIRRRRKISHQNARMKWGKIVILNVDYIFLLLLFLN
jgi:hypothetical protein